MMGLKGFKGLGIIGFRILESRGYGLWDFRVKMPGLGFCCLAELRCSGVIFDDWFLAELLPGFRVWGLRFRV